MGCVGNDSASSSSAVDLQDVMHFLQYAVFLFGVTQAVTFENAEDGFDALQQWYNQSIGENHLQPLI
jgi:hypothetical protein